MTIEMIYEDGVLKPLIPLQGLHEHQRVQVTVHSHEDARVLAGRFARFVGTLSDEEAEAMQQVIDREFERVEGDW